MPGTENVPGIIGLAKAIELATENISAKNDRIRPLRDKLIDGILQIPETRLNGSQTQRLPGNVNISFAGIEGESLLLMLDHYGIQASSGSACTSGSLDPSHVLLSLGCRMRWHKARAAERGGVHRGGCGLHPRSPAGNRKRLRAMSLMWETMQKEHIRLNADKTRLVKEGE